MVYHSKSEDEDAEVPRMDVSDDEQAEYDEDAEVPRMDARYDEQAE